MKKIALILGVVLGVVLGFAIPTWAARNSGGTFTWTSPGGEVAASGQPISSQWANSSLAEIRQALTNSLDRTGQGGMLAPLQVCDQSVTPACNTASTPGLRFVSSADSGLFYTGSPSTISLSTGGSTRQSWTAATIAMNGNTSVTGNVSSSANVTADGVLAVRDAVNNRTIGIDSPAGGITGSYTLTLPAALPAANGLVSVDSAGIITYQGGTPAPVWSAWTQPTLTAFGSASCPAGNIRYIKLNGVVYIRGVFTTSSDGYSGCSFTAPVGYRTTVPWEVSPVIRSLTATPDMQAGVSYITATNTVTCATWLTSTTTYCTHSYPVDS